MSGDLPPPDPAQRNRYDAEPASAAPASYDQLRRVLLALGGIAMVIFAIGLGLLVLRDDDDGGGSGSGSAGTFAPVTTATATAGGGIPATTGAPSTVPTVSATTAAPALPTPAPGTAPTALPTPAPGTAPAASTPDPAADAAAAGVVATAQALLDAFAEGRWNDARTLNPGRNETDDALQQAYGPIVDATVVPAAVTPLGDGRYDLRFGIVVHEDQPTGRQTVLMCSYWQVDPDQKTVDRLASARVRVEGGFIDPSSRAGELSTVCAKPIG